MLRSTVGESTATAAAKVAPSWDVVLRMDGYSGRRSVRVVAGDMQQAAEIATRELLDQVGHYLTSTPTPQVAVESITQVRP